MQQKSFKKTLVYTRYKMNQKQKHCNLLSSLLSYTGDFINYICCHNLLLVVEEVQVLYFHDNNDNIQDNNW